MGYVWGSACVACQMWHDGVHGRRKAPASTCVPTRQSLLPPVRFKFGAQTLFLPFIAPVSKGYEGRQLLRRRRQCTTPSQPNIQLPFISSFVYFGACCPALVRP